MNTLETIKSQIELLDNSEIIELVNFLKIPQISILNPDSDFISDNLSRYKLAEPSFAEEWNNPANDVWDNI
ncbi:MAG: hypothetical protein NT007_06100 [Candidatus Kapabacteria bacterium]|nr:hypothetical protein [Candidatus Kapabacteria bacterium]